MSVPARYFDGQLAGGSEVQLSVEVSKVRFIHADREHRYDVERLRLLAPVGRGDWILELPDGGSLRFQDEEFARYLNALLGKSNWVGALEEKWHWAVAALLISVVFAWATLTFGIPAAARQLAFAMPEELEEDLSSGGMEVLDRFLFEPSELDADERERVLALFAQVQDSNDDFQNYRIELRSSNIGPNAFAVPGGIVVITDELVELAASDDELIAVLAHEVGHLYGRHSLRILLQDSASAVVIASLTGDLSNITALSAAVPTVLMQAKYSRDFEREADEFAFTFMREMGISTDVLSALLLRMESEMGVEGRSALESWLSTHPPSEERLYDGG